MSVRKWMRKGILIEAILVLALSGILLWRQQSVYGEEAVAYVNAASAEDDYIKWVDFTVSYDALCSAYAWDVDTHNTEHEICWIELLAYTAARTGANFDARALDILEEAADKLSEGECTMEELTENLEYYAYYLEAYTAVLGGMVGEYEEQVEDENGNVSFQSRYGLKAYFPLARGFEYTHYDDFGVSRSYGYKRKHLGHDMMGQTGTPIIAVESGTIEALGWNQYGGWRVGIRSLDGKRYYYYAHLRQNYPFAEHLEEGSIVTAGDVIGYMGHTGYSTTENVNNIDVTHLHWGLELIFNEERREEGYEIWIDIYPLTRFLAKHTQEVVKVEGSKEWVRTTGIRDPQVEALR
ncbi:MAG: M23 family metallopeptidase [Lachnospiraceae bacterium]|nr:M23 family metallopeptidase [Lachnospiraceae bacterium]